MTEDSPGVANGSTTDESPPKASRNDSLPIWVVALLAVFLIVRGYDVGVAPFIAHPHSPHGKSPVAVETSDKDSMSDMIQTDSLAKVAFVASFAEDPHSQRPEKKLIESALSAAGDLQEDSGNEPGAARRLMILRFLAGDNNPLRSGRHGLNPLDAFGNALGPDITPLERSQYARESLIWSRIFGAGTMTAAQVDRTAHDLEHLPHLRWWRYPALMALYKLHGNAALAARAAKSASEAAVYSTMVFGFLVSMRLVLCLVGLLIFIYLLVAAVPGVSGDTQNLWQTVPERVSLSARKLGAGDLMGVFVIYLVTREVIGLLLTGYSGFGAAHHFAFEGLLTPFKPRVDALPDARRNLIGIELESFVYLISALPPIAVLVGVARKRRASLADELGWHARGLTTNSVYGLAGFALSSALIVPVALAANAIFRHAPQPSNPVIPQLIDSPNLAGTLMLVILASLAAPPIEELLFRGVFYNAAKLKLGVWPAIVLTGLVFGFVHPVGIAEMLALGTLGGVFAWMAETRKSLVPSITAHFLQNFTTTLILISVLAS